MGATLISLVTVLYENIVCPGTFLLLPMNTYSCFCFCKISISVSCVKSFLPCSKKFISVKLIINATSHNVAVLPLAILVCHIPLASEPLWALLVAAEIVIVMCHDTPYLMMQRLHLWKNLLSFSQCPSPFHISRLKCSHSSQ